jgi:DNA (cytosine-5)-methyltransferase 1
MSGNFTFVRQEHNMEELLELALFAGAGGGILGGILLGWRTVCAVEIEPYAAGVLVARQNDGLLPPFPIWDDVRTFDGKPWRGIVDVVSGGFPCQDISAAGKGAGLAGERSGLWTEFARIIGEVRPRFAFMENSPVLTSRGLGTVLGDLAALGYNTRRGVFSAAHVGANHLRERLWIVAYLDDPRLQKLVGQERDTGRYRPDRFSLPGSWGKWNPHHAIIRRGVHGMAGRVDRIRAIGNGQVPAVARLAWEVLSKGLV